MSRVSKEEYIIGSISLLANRFAQFGDSIHEDITFKQWFLLLMISKMDDEEKSLNSIADFVGTTRQNVKKLIVPLEEKKYVKVKPSKTDARALKIELAPKTYRYFEKHYETTAKKTDELFSKMNENDLDRLIQDLSKLMECFE
ncbi:MAG: winged helix DNA-binding protein [Clostridiales bacterium]|nr:winged helix DNA-binding protein [Clostridiales bacterium]